MVASLHRNGLTRLIVINGHGGNVGPILEVARKVKREKGFVIPSLYLWRIAYALMPKLYGAELAAKVAGHGADPLTSLGLPLIAEVWRPDLIPAATALKRDPLLDLPFTGLGTASFDGAEVGLPNDYDDVYTQGVGKGDPRLCSPETASALRRSSQASSPVSRPHFAAHTA